MRKLVYYTSILTIFTVLVAGIDNWFGSEIKNYSIVVFVLWVLELGTKNWPEIVEFFKILYGLDNK